jgi:hypothetical protein
MADLTWLIFGLGMTSGLIFAGIPTFILLRNLRRKGKVWAFIEYRDGIEKHYLRRPDEKTRMIEIKGKSFLTGGSRNFSFASKLDHERPAFRYHEVDQRPIAYEVSRVPEMRPVKKKTKGPDGKETELETGELEPTGRVSEIVNPFPAGPPPGAMYTALHTKIFQDTYGGGDAWKLIVLALLAISLLAILGLYAK